MRASAGMTSVRKLITAVLLASLTCAPALARADVTRSGHEATSEVGKRIAQPQEADVSSGLVSPISPGSPMDYAAREAAAPQLASFAGGSSGIYIGTGALVVVLLVVVIVLLVR